MRNEDHMTLATEIAACARCAVYFAHGCRPVVQFSDTARVVIIGQAPGARVHASGIPWDDASGARLREWTGIGADVFYDPARVALMPMGFCYPGTGANGDRPPRPECAPLWHDRILALLAPARLTLLVGIYAQAHYLPKARKLSLSDRVRAQEHLQSSILTLPHPSWRSTGWMKKNLWFESEILPTVRGAVQGFLSKPAD